MRDSLMRMLPVTMRRLGTIWTQVLAVALVLAAGCRDAGEQAARAPNATAATNTGRAGGTVVPNRAGVRLDLAQPLRQVAFGSCLDQDKPQPVWDAITRYDPQLMLMLGDNVYANAATVDALHDAYAQLAASPGFSRLREVTPVMAVWDDHDYGRNDSGAEHALKKESQRIFLDFFSTPADSPRRAHEGIYDAAIVGPVGQRVQIILLDTRYFRTQLYPIGPSRYRDLDDPDATMLGEAQWAWLRRQLSEPAEVRLLVSSVQVVANDHPYERWGVMPLQRERLFALIGDVGAAGVIVLSGDRHRGELSRLEGSAAGYPLYDLTSSSLNRPAPADEANALRVGALVTTANYGTIDIVWEGQAHLDLQLHDPDGTVVLTQTIALDALVP